MHETGVVLAFEDPALQEEVLHFLDRLPRVRVLGVAGNGSELARCARDRRPHAIVASPGVLARTPDVDGTSVLVVAPVETTASLRTALQAGATGFYLWPEEREGLGRDAERAASPPGEDPVGVSRVVAVHGPRGGAGCTFVATNLAAACADRDANTVLVDLDAFGADVTAAIGLPPDSAIPTTADLVPVAAELAEEHLDRVLHPHSRGFRVLPAPHRAGVDTLDRAGINAMLRLIRHRFDLAVLHLPRALGDAEIAALEASDVVLVVVTLDVLGVRAARRAVDLFAELGIEERCRVVLNRAARGEIVPDDVRRALGLSIAAVIRHDRAVPRAQNRGAFVAGRGSPAGRQLAVLSRTILRAEGS
jgi:pilus assembly protein CpaE